MRDDQSARWAMPMIHPGQAQKEMSHNEALAHIDMLLHPAVIDMGVDIPPEAAGPGDCWIVGDAPVGAWSGHAGALACWTGNGWRMIAPRPGLCCFHTMTEQYIVWRDGGWRVGELSGERLSIGGRVLLGAVPPAIPALSADADTADVVNAVQAMMAALTAHGLIETVA